MHRQTATAQVSLHSISRALVVHTHKIIEQPHHKTNKIICVPSEDSDQPGHPPSLIRVLAVHSMGS